MLPWSYSAPLYDSLFCSYLLDKTTLFPLVLRNKQTKPLQTHHKETNLPLLLSSIVWSALTILLFYFVFVIVLINYFLFSMEARSVYIFLLG